MSVSTYLLRCLCHAIGEPDPALIAQGTYGSLYRARLSLSHS
jgi:hypothetical protein